MKKYSKLKKKYAILYLLPISNLKFTIPFESHILYNRITNNIFFQTTILENAVIGKSQAFTAVLIIGRVPIIIIYTAIMSFLKYLNYI